MEYVSVTVIGLLSFLLFLLNIRLEKTWSTGVRASNCAQTAQGLEKRSFTSLYLQIALRVLITVQLAHGCLQRTDERKVYVIFP